MAFSDNLKNLRSEKNITQDELAKKLCIKTRTIMNYESGSNYPTVEILKRISQYFDISMDALMTEEDNFISLAYERGGRKGAKEAEELVNGVAALFAGGSLSDEDQEAAMMVIQRAYWMAKEENKKYIPKRFRKTSDE